MDSNPKQCLSRYQEVDNLPDDQKDAASSLGASCGTSSSITSPSPISSETGKSRQSPSTSRGMEEMTSPSPAVAERMKGAEDQRVVASSSPSSPSSSASSSSASSASQGGGVGEPHTARTTADDLALALRGSPPQCVMQLSPDKHSSSNSSSNSNSNSSGNSSSNTSSNSSGHSSSSSTNTTVPGCSQMSGGGSASASQATDLKKEKTKKTEETATTTTTTTAASSIATAREEPQSTPDRGTKRSRDDVESEEVAAPLEARAKRKKKNKNGCFKCSRKLELAQRGIIGRCRCERVFCPLHRLPEQHDCDFDHKEEGRQQSREKMVKPTRHLGTSCRRLEDNSF